ncbi:MAG: glycine zipper domain-containing protein [Acidithiobacillus sp.]|uniref:glycine zipper domain-containing protein n=1 Tax=Acidithiobacillus sp. TaxID=1872118 RepID=UPI0025B7D79F|nr:glycine zipper domain-containing protein [Acidithiobacillus sp.]
MKTARWALVTILPLILAGCANNPYASDRTTANTAGGALLGSIAGAVIGNQTGSPLAGAAIGAGIGGLAGYGISKSQEQSAPPAPQPGYYAPPPSNVQCPPGYVCTPTAPQYQNPTPPPPSCPPGYTCTTR